MVSTFLSDFCMISQEGNFYRTHISFPEGYYLKKNTLDFCCIQQNVAAVWKDSFIDRKEMLWYAE
jgi:hypothetical protein